MKTFTRRRRYGAQDSIPLSAVRTGQSAPAPDAAESPNSPHNALDEEELQEETESFSALKIRDKPQESDARITRSAAAAAVSKQGEDGGSRKRNLVLSPCSQQASCKLRSMILVSLLQMLLSSWPRATSIVAAQHSLHHPCTAIIAVMVF